MVNKAHQKVKTVLENIYEKHFLGIEDPVLGIQYSFSELLYSDNEILDGSEDVLEILNHLRDKEIIKDYNDIKKDTCFIDFPPDFRSRARAYIRELSGDETQKENTHQNMTALYLDNDGNLWHTDKDKFCYSMRAKSKRFQTLKYLIENNGYQTSESMVSQLERDNAKTLRSEIGKIRNEITKCLGIDGNEVIQSKEHSGYRINPKYKIIQPKQ